MLPTHSALIYIFSLEFLFLCPVPQLFSSVPLLLPSYYYLLSLSQWQTVRPPRGLMRRTLSLESLKPLLTGCWFYLMMMMILRPIWRRKSKWKKKRQFETLPSGSWGRLRKVPLGYQLSELYWHNRTHLHPSSRMQLRRRILDFGKLVELQKQTQVIRKLRMQKEKKKEKSQRYGFYYYSFVYAFHNKKNWQVAPPIKSKKLKVAVIIFLYKGVVNVN